MSLTNAVQDVHSQCKVVYYDWDVKDLHVGTSDTQLSKSSRLDISSQIMSCTFDKNNSAAAGNFSIKLSNSPDYGDGDWKSILKRGSWLLIFMAQDGSLRMNPTVGAPLLVGGRERPYLRALCRIDRVSVSTQTLSTGALDISFNVTGRDFGCIYEDTTIWHNMFETTKLVLESINQTKLNVLGTTYINEAIDIIHDLIFYPKNLDGIDTEEGQSLTDSALQWLLPSELVMDLGMYEPNSFVQSDDGTLYSTREPYWGALPNTKNFSGTEATLAISTPADMLTGNAWSNLKSLSVPELHELYTELTDDGVPSLVFRPIPFAINKTKYPTAAKYIQHYKDLAVVSIDAINLVSLDLGEDEQNRYNSFLATVATTMFNNADNIGFLRGTRFPFHLQDSIKRHGFKAMHVSIDSLVRNASGNQDSKLDGKASFKLLVEFNEVLYDYWFASAYSESGSAMIVGTNDVRIGKALTFNDNVPYSSGRRYYIEGYVDTFSVNEKGVGIWTQDLSLTRGFEEKDLVKAATKDLISVFQERGSTFTHQGEYTPSGRS